MGIAVNEGPSRTAKERMAIDEKTTKKIKAIVNDSAVTVPYVSGEPPVMRCFVRRSNWRSLRGWKALR